MGKRDVLTDRQWARISELLPPEKGAMGRPSKPNRPIVEGIIHRYRAGIPWRDLPERFGPWQTAWKRHHKWSADGTWDALLTEILADADADGAIDWDATIARAHQHGTNIRRPDAKRSSYTGGATESQEAARA